MLSTSEAKSQLEKTSFRALLNALINDYTVSSILIGEIHNISPTLDSIFANLDLLANSPRRIIIISEDLNQADNPTLKSSFNKAEKEGTDPLKKATFLKERTVTLYEFIYASFSAGLMVLGAENKITNPFSIYKSKDLTFDVLRKMEAYQKKPERITVANEEFAKLINSCCSEDTLILFIGGGTHVVALNSKEGPFDPGIQGRVKNSVSIYLNSSVQPATSITTGFTYSAPDRELTGQYDYMVQTSSLVLYKEALDSMTDLDDKIQYLIDILDKFISSHIFFPNNVTFVLKDDLKSILEAFQLSTGWKCSFTFLATILEDVVQEKNAPREKFLFFNLPRNTSSYSKEALAVAIRNDLAELIESKANSSPS